MRKRQFTTRTRNKQQWLSVTNQTSLLRSRDYQILALNRTCSIWYQNVVQKNWYQIAWHAYPILVPVFWYQNLVLVSGTYIIMGITVAGTIASIHLPTHRGMARLSWPAWLITCQGGLPVHIHHLTHYTDVSVYRYIIYCLLRQRTW